MRIFSDGGNWRSWAKRVGSRARSASGSCRSTGFMSSTRPSLLSSLLEPLSHPGHEATHLEQVGHELRESLGTVLVALREVADDALLEIDLELVSFLDSLRSLRRLKDRVAHVDGVAEEDAGEGIGDHKRDPGTPDGDGRDLARGPAAEVGPADEDVALSHARRPRLAAWHALHPVVGHMLFGARMGCVLGPDGAG